MNESLLFDRNPIPMLIYDVDSLNILRVNDAAAEKYGYSKDEFMQLTIEDIPRLHSVLEELEEGLDGTRNIRHQAEDGEICYVQINSHAFDYEGHNSRMVSMIDISGEKEAEQRLARQKEMIQFVNELANEIGSLDNYDEALEVAIQKVCNFIGWPVGHAYKLNGGQEEFASTNIWYLEEPGKYDEIIELSKKHNFVSGKGFLGEVIRSEQPQWMQRIHLKEKFVRKRNDNELNLKTCFAFPVKIGNRVSVLLEFFHYKDLDFNPDYAAMVRALESQLSHILERIKAREELMLNEQKYRRLFERANDGILIMRGKEIEDCNSRLEELFECSREEIIGETPFRFSPEVQPNGQKSVIKGQEYIRKTINGAPQVFEWKHKTAKGDLIDTEISLNRIKLPDGVYIQGIVRDITQQKESERALKRSEELFRNLFLRAPVAMVMVDQDNKVKMANSTFEEVFGFREEELEGEDIDEFIVPEGKHEIAPNMPGANIFQQDFIREFTRKTKEGREIDVLVGSIPVYLEGEPLAGFGIYIDITDQKNTQRKLESSLREKEILLKEIHHRVKNNLAVISALLELQVFSEDNKKINKILGDGLLRIKTMALVHETLYKTENFANLKLSSYIDKLITYNRDAANTDKKEIEIHQEVEDIDLNINQAIPCALVLNEFMSNAFKYAFENQTGGKLGVKIWQQKEAVHVLVEDDGIGLPSNFEEMRKTSMGMTLIDQLTEQLNGNLKITSDNGTSFELVFRKSEAAGSSAHFIS